jgi:4-carboxymuconolactone decarboxylase
MSRIPQLSEAELNTAQRTTYDAILKSRGSISGPFRIWLHSPEFAQRAQSLGEFARYNTSLEPRQSELAILLTARSLNCQVEWSLHERFALEAGLNAAVIDCIRDHKEPDFSAPDEKAIYDFSAELLRENFVQDLTFQAAQAHLGGHGVVELVGIIGYYNLVAMTLNAFQVPLPGDAQALLPDCPTFT